MPSVHLLVIVHGLWGQRQHVAAIGDVAAARCAPETTTFTSSPQRSRPRATSSAAAPKDDDVELVILSASGNEGTQTYDGIDTCAERVCAEIDAEIIKIEGQGLGDVTRFSIVGYSLGGLIARYAIGLLHSREPSFFDAIRPVNFATIASPAIGLPRYRGVFAGLIHWGGSNLLSRSGRQMYARDRFHDGKPLLEVMSEPGSSFHAALVAFERIEIYANAFQDRTVPFPTGGIAAHDRFDAARRSARQARSAAGLPTDNDDEDLDLDLREGGLSITLDTDYPVIISSLEDIDPVAPSSDPSRPIVKRSRFRLPPFLRPSFYFFYPVWLRYTVVFLFPIYLPLLLIAVTITFSVQSQRSRQRIKAMRAKTGLADRTARMQRVGIRERIEAAVEEVMVAVDEADAPTPTPSSPSGGPAKPVAVWMSTDPQDPVMTPAQLRMIANLDSIAHLRKHYAYFPKARNSHAVIVCRDPKQFPAHEEGRIVLRHWADGFRL